MYFRFEAGIHTGRSRPVLTGAIPLRVAMNPSHGPGLKRYGKGYRFS